MKTGVVPRDPQFGILLPIAPVANVERVSDGETVSAGTVTLTAHSTPGHTPGGMNRTSRSCEKGRCLSLVYADSVSAVSADGYLFGKRTEKAHGEDFERRFAFLESTACDLLITPHPEVAGLWTHMAEGRNADALIDTAACRTLAGNAREQLKKRFAGER